MRYVTFAVRAILGGVALWVLFVIAGLGNPWVSIGVVGFVVLIALVNRMTRRRVHKTGLPTPEHRVISTDQDRWGGGSI